MLWVSLSGRPVSDEDAVVTGVALVIPVGNAPGTGSFEQENETCVA